MVKNQNISVNIAIKYFLYLFIFSNSWQALEWRTDNNHCVVLRLLAILLDSNFLVSSKQ